MPFGFVVAAGLEPASGYRFALSYATNKNRRPVALRTAVTNKIPNIAAKPRYDPDTPQYYLRAALHYLASKTSLSKQFFTSASQLNAILTK